MTTDRTRRIARARAAYDRAYGKLIAAIREDTADETVTESEAARQAKFSRQYIRDIRAGKGGEAPPKHRRPSSS